jgi:hypothetical protein
VKRLAAYIAKCHAEGRDPEAAVRSQLKVMPLVRLLNWHDSCEDGLLMNLVVEELDRRAPKATLRDIAEKQAAVQAAWDAVTA